ncbi:hypothetical protein BHE74_00050772 [Ensete ventricosum]|uniref:Uncharacterized protein n=1 Tax=Ensete ventricosum TaxID=4639 RepID=A0A445MHK4_ENSVE|nr:hypothetical protein BHE74_00050772 [Ensete ventricosum]RZR73747.1 hypothetical protein BHM03_00027746 [Ensete ventricosum]
MPHGWRLLPSTSREMLFNAGDPRRSKGATPYTLMVAISFVRIQEEQLNHEVRRTRVAPRLAMPRPTAPSNAIQAPAPK